MLPPTGTVVPVKMICYAAAPLLQRATYSDQCSSIPDRMTLESRFFSESNIEQFDSRLTPVVLVSKHCESLCQTRNKQRTVLKREASAGIAVSFKPVK